MASRADRSKGQAGFDLPLVASVLKRPPFEHVDKALLAEIRPMLKPKTYRQGDVLFKQGDNAENLFVIYSGRVQISARDDASNWPEVSIVSRGAGEVLGELELINPAPMPATATALDAPRVVLVPRAALKILLQDPTFKTNLLKTVCCKLSQTLAEEAHRFQVERHLFAEFQAHVSDQVLQELMVHGVDYGAPRKEHAYILFSDIRNFTASCSKMKPLKIAEQLTPYLNHAVDVVHRCNGMVDKFVGDAVMAIWGEFLTSQSTPAKDVLTCAGELVKTASEFKLGGSKIRVGVGIDSGPDVFIGNVGGEGKRQFTVLGEAVNMASRYESKTKDLGVPIVFGANFFEQLKNANDPRLHQLKEHKDEEVKGAGLRTVYSFNPLAEK